MTDTNRELNEEFRDEDTQPQVISGEPLAGVVGASAYDKQPSGQSLIEDPYPEGHKSEDA